MPPSSYAIRRSPRVQPPHGTTAVLRFEDGSHEQAELKTFSLTGGLVFLPRPVDRSSHVKLMFVTHAGAIHCSAEMLQPIDRDLQPFRFVELGEHDQRKLRMAIRSHLGQNSAGEDLNEYRNRLTHGTFFGDLLGYDLKGDDLLGVNRDPEQNCPICGIAGHNHTVSMTKACASKLVHGDDQTGMGSKSKLI